MVLHTGWHSGSGRMTERTEGEGHYLPANRGSQSALFWFGLGVVLWAGIARYWAGLGWFWDGLGVVLWAGSCVALGWFWGGCGLRWVCAEHGGMNRNAPIFAEKCKKSVKKCKIYCIYGKKVVPLYRIWE